MDIIRTWFNGIVIASLGTVSIPVILLWALFVPFLDVPGLVVSVKFTNEKPAEVETETETETVEEDEEETYAEEKPIQVSEDEDEIPEEHEEDEKENDEKDNEEKDNEEVDEKHVDDTVPETRTDPNLIDAEWNANKAEEKDTNAPDVQQDAETDNQEKNTILPDVQEPEPILSETALKDAMTDLYSKKTE